MKHWAAWLCKHHLRYVLIVMVWLLFPIYIWHYFFEGIREALDDAAIDIRCITEWEDGEPN